MEKLEVSLNELLSIIVIPVTRKDSFETVLNRLRIQTYRTIEILICTRTQEEIERVQEFQAVTNDSRIRTVSCVACKDYWDCISTAMNQARGKWVSFVFDETIWNPAKAESQLFVLKKEAKSVIFTNGYWGNKQLLVQNIDYVDSKKNKVYYKYFLENRCFVWNSLLADIDIMRKLAFEIQNTDAETAENKQQLALLLLACKYEVLFIDAKMILIQNEIVLNGNKKAKKHYWKKQGLYVKRNILWQTISFHYYYGIFFVTCRKVMGKIFMYMKKIWKRIKKR